MKKSLESIKLVTREDFKIFNTIKVILIFLYISEWLHIFSHKIFIRLNRFSDHHERQKKIPYVFDNNFNYIYYCRLSN